MEEATKFQNSFQERAPRRKKKTPAAKQTSFIQFFGEALQATAEEALQKLDQQSDN